MALTKEAIENISQQLAQTWRGAQERAAPMVQQLGAQWRALSPVQRNAIIGALAGGATTGVASAATNGRIVRDLIIGALLGGTAGGGGTYALSRFPKGLGGGFASPRTLPYDPDEVRDSLPKSPLAEALGKGIGVAGVGTAVGYPASAAMRRHSALQGALDAKARESLAKVRATLAHGTPAEIGGALPEWLTGLSRESMARRATPATSGSGVRDWLRNRLSALRFSLGSDQQKIISKDVEREILEEIYRGGYGRASAIAGQMGERGALSPLARESAVRSALSDVVPKNFRLARYAGALGIPAALYAGWASSGD